MSKNTITTESIFPRSKNCNRRCTLTFMRHKSFMRWKSKGNLHTAAQKVASLTSANMLALRCAGVTSVQFMASHAAVLCAICCELAHTRTRAMPLCASWNPDQRIRITFGRVTN